METKPAAPALKTAAGGLPRAVWTLFRFIPVLSWSLSATLIAAAAVVGRIGWRVSLLPDILLVALGTSLFQGLIAHGINDLEDWRSGTDRHSPGILSGGSRVIPRSLLNRAGVARAVAAAMVLGLGSGLALHFRHGPVVWLVVLVGLWSAVAYTAPPLRLAYRPLAGELLSGWPAVVAMIVGGVAVMGAPEAPGAVVWAAAAIQATFSVAWVMQHHLPDIAADLGASPPKVTTPAYFARRWGLQAARLVPAGYYVLAAAISLVAATVVGPAFAVSAPLAAVAAGQAVATDVSSVPDITRRQLRMMAITGANAAFLAAAFLAGWFGR